MAKDITCNVNPLFYVNSVNDSIVVQHVSVAQVRNVITSLKDSSPGWDHLSPFVMKQCVDTYVEPITVLINPLTTADFKRLKLSITRFKKNVCIWYP